MFDQDRQPGMPAFPGQSKPSFEASTFINGLTKSKHEVFKWVLTMLGWPLVQVELTREQLEVCLQNATEKYTKYATFPEKYLIVHLKDYIHGKGLDLSKWHVAAVYGLDSEHDNLIGLGTDMIWGLPNALLQSGAYPFFGNGGISGGWTTLECAHEWIKLAQRMRGTGMDYRFDRYKQMLTLMPEPKFPECQNESALLTVECIPEDEELYQNEYVKRLFLAYSKILLGTVRKKFSNVQLLGGGSIDTTIGDEGRDELQQIMDNIRSEESSGNGCIIG